MHDAQDFYSTLDGPENNDIVADRKSPQVRPKVVARFAHAGLGRRQSAPLVEIVQKAIAGCVLPPFCRRFLSSDEEFDTVIIGGRRAGD